MYRVLEEVGVGEEETRRQKWVEGKSSRDGEVDGKENRKKKIVIP